MDNWTPTPEFEDRVRQSFAVPEIRSEFVEQMYGEIMRQAEAKTKKRHYYLFGLRPAWLILLIVLFAMIVSTLIIGPQRVYASFMKLLGYIPGVGVVDTSAPIRVLAEPVSVTRDGVTVTVTSATLTREKTQIVYRIFGVPSSAYPDREDVMGCVKREYLRLKDGTQLAQINYGYEPIPANVNEAVFVIPCIANTLPGKIPENWELPLRFNPAPPDMTVMPVIELSPSPKVNLTPGVPMDSTSEAPVDSSVTVNKVVETSDGYILIGQFQPHSKSGESFQQTGALKIQDANGMNVSYALPLDLNEEINQGAAGMPGVGWAAQFKAAGLVYPLTISFSGVKLIPANPDASVEFNFDAGPNPQPGQVWNLNQNIQLAGRTLVLVSITADSREGYSFKFKVPSDVYSARVQIAGFAPNGGGGGGGGGLTNGEFHTSLSFPSLPTGMLTVTVSDLVLIGNAITWQGQWSPQNPRTDLPTELISQSGLCLTADSLEKLQLVPPALSNGKALIYEKLDTGLWGLSIHTLDGNRKQVVVPNGNWGSLSPDGTQVAYSAVDNRIHIVDLVSLTEKVLPGTGGFNLNWSPDGEQLAYVGMGNGVINSVFVINADGTQVRQVSDFNYESIIGWSSSNLLYFVAPYTGGAAWKVYSYDFASNTAQDRFTIENGTPKFLNPKLSPDGNWIAYRGRDNSSLYLVRNDGSNMHLVLDNVGANGIEWSRSGWLGVSLKKANSEESTIIIIKPEECEGYILPTNLNGDLEGLFIP